MNQINDIYDDVRQDCSGEHIEAFVDPATVANHDGLSRSGTALLIENVAVFLEQSTSEKYLNLHNSCIAAVIPNTTTAGGDYCDSSSFEEEEEEFVGI